MSFAIWYNRQDLTPIAAEFTRQDLSPADRAYAQSLWNAGLSGWNTAPVETDPFHSGNDPDCRRIVINGKHQGKTLTLADFRAFLYRQSLLPGAEYLDALANDMGGASGAMEPWPVV